jgi:hypothetical protein
LRPLRTGNSSKSWKKAQELRREQQQPSDWLGIRSGPLKISHPESIRGSAREEMICTIRSGRKIPSAVRYGKEARRLRLGFQGASPGDCGPSDVHTESRKPLDREKVRRVYLLEERTRRTDLGRQILSRLPISRQIR